MRSHQEDIVEVCHNKLAQALVSIGKDSSIKVWNCESLDQIHEFNTAPTDPPTKICSAYHDDTIAVGFKSGFLRVFNLSGEEKKIIYEIMIFDVPVMDIAYSE
jgi:WD40 repeat protein